MNPRPPQLFQYRLSVPSHRLFPGGHRGLRTNNGQLFNRHEPLMAHPDPRRIDLRASVLDVSGTYKVRAYRQPSVFDVVVLADMSASMGQTGQTPQQTIMLDGIRSIAQSAFSYGDRFSFIGCGASTEKPWLLGNCRHLGRLQAFVRQWQQHRLTATSLCWQPALPHLPLQRSLVFILSDFHFNAVQLKTLLQALARHDVVPLVLWQAEDYLNLPNWGLVNYQDAESGSMRTLFMRPVLRQKILQAFAQRRQDLQQLCRSYGNEPLFLTDGFNPMQLQRYFLSKA
ncbi:MxaS protein [Methylovulum psychrotolerans]|uniref:DUF58 domain-containing protein n=1 Tax=Methylovulum psychrotolerans TaxID=1704499 RepID=UPI001BFF164E|nr:MxaS protein [Methylovulum psychrotolerans]MBT9097936.1 MxaS protein [Methylovulum psychrotolerans]